MKKLTKKQMIHNISEFCTKLPEGKWLDMIHELEQIISDSGMTLNEHPIATVREFYNRYYGTNNP